MVPRYVLLAFLLFASCEQSFAQDRPFVCPITLPNGSTPPGEVLRNTGHHGDGAIWTMYNPGGRILGRGAEFRWWQAVVGELTVVGRRLDAPASPLRATIERDRRRGIQMSYLRFPTLGCWEITARAGNATLTFVVEMIR